ncbi:hypothetical protein E2562_011594, partial [Oryza meyeriana var. granulata]
RKQSSDSGSGKGDGGDGRVSGGRRVWRRRKLTKEDDMLRYKLERIPFLEEKVRKVRENGKIICLDINQLMLSQENRFAFTMEVAEEANSYLEKNRHEYGLKKPILHVLSDRMNEAGFSRPEGDREWGKYNGIGGNCKCKCNSTPTNGSFGQKESRMRLDIVNFVLQWKSLAADTISHASSFD